MLVLWLLACPGNTPDTDTDAVDTDEAEVETVCSDAAPAPTEGTCDVSGSGSALVLHGTVLGPDEIWVGGGVRVENGNITCVGCDCPTDDAVELFCGEATISPGLINLHDHISFDEAEPLQDDGTRWDHRNEWRNELSTPSNDHGSDGTAWGELRHLLTGTTSIVGSGGVEGIVRNLEKSGLSGDGLPILESETFPLGDSDSVFRSNCDWDYEHTSYEVESAGYVPHVAEGINDYALAEFECQSRPEGGEHDFLEQNAAFVHAIGLTTPDYARMAEVGATLVWSPRSNIRLYGQTANVTLLATLDGNIALGTDWTYSGSPNLLRELACADSLNTTYFEDAFSDGDFFGMVTKNAAKAVLLDDHIGVLKEGALADLAVFRGNTRHDAVIRSNTNGVALVLLGGDPVYGDEEILSGLGKSCEVVDVCGRDRQLCVEETYGTSYATLSAEMANAWPAMFCGVPEGEATCEPSRPGSYDGPTADDADGDGLLDGEDLCPDTFDPLRPMDDGIEPDADQDGVGDACDSTPLPADLDGDGFDDSEDVCPYDASSDQTDSDGDGRGDECDACPDQPNTGLCE